MKSREEIISELIEHKNDLAQSRIAQKNESRSLFYNSLTTLAQVCFTVVGLALVFLPNKSSDDWSRTFLFFGLIILFSTGIFLLHKIKYFAETAGNDAHSGGKEYETDVDLLISELDKSEDTKAFIKFLKKSAGKIDEPVLKKPNFDLDIGTLGIVLGLTIISAPLFSGSKGLFLALLLIVIFSQLIFANISYRKALDSCQIEYENELVQYKLRKERYGMQ